MLCGRPLLRRGALLIGAHPSLYQWVPALRCIAEDALHRVRDTRSSSSPIFRFPWPALPQYHPFAYTVICTSSGAVIAQNEDGGPTWRNFMALRRFGAAAATAVGLAL